MRKYKYYVVLMGILKGTNNAISYMDYWCEYDHPIETKEEITKPYLYIIMQKLSGTDMLL